MVFQNFSSAYLFQIAREKILITCKEGHCRKLTFLSSPIASKHSAFPLTEVSVSEVPPILKKSVLKD